MFALVTRPLCAKVTCTLPLPDAPPGLRQLLALAAAALNLDFAVAVLNGGAGGSGSGSGSGSGGVGGSGAGAAGGGRTTAGLVLGLTGFFAARVFESPRGRAFARARGLAIFFAAAGLRSSGVMPFGSELDAALGAASATIAVATGTASPVKGSSLVGVSGSPGVCSAALDSASPLEDSNGSNTPARATKKPATPTSTKSNSESRSVPLNRRSLGLSGCVELAGGASAGIDVRPAASGCAGAK